MIGSDGYDNYQAPTDLNNKVDHQLFLRRLWVKGDLNFIASPQINSTLKCIENVKNVRYLNDNAFVSIERKFYELNNLGQYKDPNLIENRVMMYTNDLYHQQQPQDSPKDIVPSNLQHKIYFKLTSIDLLKYSMLTYNLHKIHYDYKYSNCIENLPNLLVHGPFQITLLLYYFQCKYPNQVIKSFTYRTFNPCFCNTEVGIAINELDTLKEQKGSNEEKYELSLVSADSKTVYMKGTLLCCKT
ncbi:uncharacterized protein KGF55_001007 [Candida pseudojiufengensis]|uniref:uncharacterized protein n=1 Tax=Candida pseudojiufengensis TaxID=497109 RepID=UPI0022257ADA|nr:uncharacterized protein KGF55_001007 [Candida pseudojiufengensis]KAI5965645.1 hypothetical protein KGF55_001007 [Candida pseudojiufengensis]